MGALFSLIKGKLKNIELRILQRESVEFILFPNVQMSYRMNLKQEYQQGVEKMDTNAWEVDLLTEKTGNLAERLKEKMTQTTNKKKQKTYQEENMEAEMEQKQLRKIQSRINGLKNRLNERTKQIDIQKSTIKQIRLAKDKIQFQCDIMKQMIRQEQEKYDKFRNFDFAYVTKTFKLTETKKPKKFTTNSPLKQSSNLMMQSRPFASNHQVSLIKTQEAGRRRDSTSLIKQYIQEESTPRRGVANKSQFGFTQPKIE